MLRSNSKLLVTSKSESYLSAPPVAAGTKTGIKTSTPNDTPNDDDDDDDRPLLSESERGYGISGKGFLSKFERRLKDLDAEADVLDVSAAAGIDPRRRFSISGKANSSYNLDAATTNSSSRKNYNNLDMSLETDARGNVALEESELNYKRYMDKVQRDFENIALEEQSNGNGNGNGNSNSNSNSPRKVSFVNSSRNDGDNKNNTSNYTSQTTTSTINASSSSSLDGIFRASRSFSSNSNSSRGALAVRSLTLGLVALMLVCNMVASSLMWSATTASLAAAQQARQQSVLSVNSESGRLVLTTKDDNTKDGGSTAVEVSTIGAGKMITHSVMAPRPPQVIASSSLIAFESAGEIESAFQEHPYTCIGLEEAVDMWKSTMEGVVTNVLLVHADVDKEGSDVFDERDDDDDINIDIDDIDVDIDNDDIDIDSANHNDDVIPGKFTVTHSSSRTERGVQLTFQGAIQNGTHACLPTLNRHQTLCIDFTSRNCETMNESSNEDNIDINNDKDNDNESDLHHERREVFQKTMAEAFVIAGRMHHSAHEACQNGDIDRNWCHSFATVVLVSSSSSSF